MTSRLPFIPLLLTLTMLIIGSVVVSVTLGSEKIALQDVTTVLHGRTLGTPDPDSVWDTIVWEMRLPRALLAVMAGAGLAIAGAGMQTLVRNPLADPYLLGISAGASVGATAVIVWGALSQYGVYALSVGALIGALSSALIVYLVATAQGGLTPVRLVLTGVVLSSAFSAIASLMVFLSDDNRSANSVMFWMLGSVAGATWDKLLIPLLVLSIVAVLMVALHGWMDALAAGAETATALGINVQAMRTGLFVALGILIGVLVAVSGGIGFVGLIIPHAARLVVGATHRMMLPIAALGGGLFLLWVDVIARVIARPQELPLGVVTGVIGAPIFLWLMGRRQYSFGGRQ